MGSGSNRQTGAKGESLAAAYLERQGYRIIQKNFRLRNGEIDIIAIDQSHTEKVLAFIEVKTRTSDQFGSPLEAITPWKLRFLVRSAQVYKLSHKNLPDPMRIDAVAITLTSTNEPEKIELMKNISGF